MKNSLLYLASLLLLILASCSSDKDYVSTDWAENGIVMTPARGGAIVHYNLPDDPNVVSIHVRYLDCYGQPILRTGSIHSDSLKLVGFNEAQSDIPCKVSLGLRNGDESESVDFKFSTLDSAPIYFINSMKVESGWNGFSINYDAPEDVQGVYNVFYLGENPYTHQSDTVLLDSKNIIGGGDTIIYQPKQLKEKNTIIVKVEDYRGHTVKQRQWEVEAMETEKHDGIKIYYDNSVEDDAEKLGVQYLTDGDTNGWRWFESEDEHKSYTFISKKNGCGEGSSPMYVDIGEQIPTAEVRLYAYLFKGKGRGSCGWGVPCWYGYYCKRGEQNIIGQTLNNSYYNRLPCDVDIYGCREASTSTDFENMTWEKIGSLKESTFKAKDEGVKNCWFFGCFDTRSLTSPSSDGSAEEVKALTPKYVSIKFMASGQGSGYRYLKLVFNDTYRAVYESGFTTNTLIKVITFNELEVYTKK
jgi:hypothetical protein